MRSSSRRCTRGKTWVGPASRLLCPLAAMVSGALEHSQADVALAISGIAGPGGERPGKPVGTVCFAWQLQGQRPWIETRNFSGDRNNVRQQAVLHALQVLLNELERP